MPIKSENKVDVINAMLPSASDNDLEVMQDIIKNMLSPNADLHREMYELMIETVF